METITRSERVASEALQTSRVLRLLYGGRFLVSVIFFGTAVLVGDVWAAATGLPLPTATERIASVGLLLGIGTAAVSLWYTHLAGRPASKNFLYLQAFVDLALVTAIVHVSGGSRSVIPPLLYVALCGGYALLLPFRSAVLVALYSGVAYLGEVAVAYPDQLGVVVAIQAGIFTVVAGATSVLGGRLQQVRTDVRVLEGELHRVRLRTTDLLHTLDTAVFTVDEEGSLAYMNPAAEELLEVDAGAYLGGEFLPHLRRWAPDVTVALAEGFERGRAIHDRECRVTIGEEAPFPVAVSTAVMTRSDAPTAITAAIKDLRPIRRIEELRARTRRLQSVAELSASLAHEIRNPLASIRSAVQQLERLGDENGGEKRELLTRLVVRESDRLTQLLEEFGDFARVDISDRGELDLVSLVQDAVEVVRQHPDTPATARFRVLPRGELDDVWGDPDLVHRTLVNLLLNAVQMTAPVREPKVDVVLDELRPDLVPATIHLGTPVRIRVLDNGPGIPPGELDRIFDPFYSGREGGSGLGLAIAHRAVQAHRGALFAHSRPNRGAAFVIVLPRRDVDSRLGSDATDLQEPETDITSTGG